MSNPERRPVELTAEGHPHSADTTAAAQTPRWAGGAAEPRGAARRPVRHAGAAPFGEQIVMWSNFIGRSHDEIVEARERWQRARKTGGTPDDGSERVPGDVGPFPTAWTLTLPTPKLPHLSLR